MVTAEEHKALMAECEQWRQQLREKREQLQQLKTKLYKAAAGKTEHDFLVQVEHFHNQFHIQLINIHDLKHSIKHHVADAEHHPNFGHKIPHHILEEQYNTLIADIDKLSEEFHTFIGVQQ